MPHSQHPLRRMKRIAAQVKSENKAVRAAKKISNFLANKDPIVHASNLTEKRLPQ
jgi:ferritin-like protein